MYKLWVRALTILVAASIHSNIHIGELRSLMEWSQHVLHVTITNTSISEFSYNGRQFYCATYDAEIVERVTDSNLPDTIRFATVYSLNNDIKDHSELEFHFILEDTAKPLRMDTDYVVFLRHAKPGWLDTAPWSDMPPDNECIDDLPDLRTGWSIHPVFPFEIQIDRDTNETLVYEWLVFDSAQMDIVSFHRKKVRVVPLSYKCISIIETFSDGECFANKHLVNWPDLKSLIIQEQARR